MDEAGRKRADFVWYEEQQLKKASERIKHIRSTNKDALDLADLGLTYLPEAVCELQHIQELYLSGNRLTKLPVCLSRLKLRILDLNGNQFTHVPYAISQLEKLEMLGLANNLIDELPEWIWRLQALTDVDVEFNRLGALPESIRQLKSLQLLRLTGNAGLNLPAEILNGNNPSLILDYYFRAAGPLNEAKLILVGRGEVGKTSLVNQLIHDHFEPQMKTEGIQITRWPIKINSEEVRLHVWDFGGQEIMHATHQFFLTERSLYLVVLNGREGGEDADVEYWLKMIESFAGDSPVIIVLNKIRSHGFDLNRRGLQEKYLGRIVSFVRTDCIDGTGIEELRRAIIRSTDHLPHLRDRFPKSWFAIKDHLSIIQDTYNYVSFERYRELCKDHGESDQQAQELLATSLHCLGIALNYRDDPRLRDTHVLNPQWVTNGIYRILNSDLIESNRGEVSPDNLRSILDSTAYPPRMHDFLLNLMRKFELCFPFPDPRDNILLVPQLLGKEQPALGNEFEPGTCLNFRFAYSVLPEGILPRFIVRTHALSRDAPRWRTGVVLEFEGNRALVKADSQEKQISISINGPLDGRRRLLAVIRSDLDRIHADMPRLKPSALVPIGDQTIPYEELQAYERTGVAVVPRYLNGRVIELNVAELLNSLEVVRSATNRPMKVFVSYSHKDDELRAELDVHLKLLQRLGVVEVWNDRRISPSDEWRQQIDRNLNEADLVILLVSADFLASDYCFDLEMKIALEREARAEARVLPIILRECNWERAPFSYLQALPPGGKAVRLWTDRDSAWASVTRGIEKLISEKKASSASQ